MKILHATGTFLPVKGGCPYFIHHLTRYLENRGDTCRVVTTGRGDRTAAQTVAVDRARSRTVAGLPISPDYPVVLQRAITEFSPDVIHTHYPLPFYPEVASVLAKLADIPVVMTCHGAFEMTLTSAIGIFGNVYNRTLLHASMRTADRIHVSNDEILSAFSLFDRYHSKVSTVPMGVDTVWYDPVAVSNDPPYPVEDGVSTILFVGTFRRYKELNDLIAAFATLDDVDAHLVLVGDGPLRGNIESAVADHRVADRVTITGRLDDEALRRAYAGADVFVLPSPTMSESFGLVTLEAMAMEVPTVVTAGSGIGGVLADERAGTVVEPGDPRSLADAVRKLLTDDQYYRNQVTAGTELIKERFAWNSLIGEYRDLYREVDAA